MIHYLKSVSFLVITLFLASCSIIKWADRVDKDHTITSVGELKGIYKQIDTVSNGLIFEYVVIIDSLSTNSISYQMIKNDSLLINEVLHGKIENGYFNPKKKYNKHFSFGPILWTLSETDQYIGLTKNKDHLIIMKDSGATLFFLIIPFMTGGNQHNLLFKKIE